MNDLYSVITGLALHAYEIVAFLMVLSLPVRMLMRAFHGRSPL